MDEPIPPVPPAPPVPPVKPTPWFKILLAAIGVLLILGLFGNLYLLARNQKPAAEVTPASIQITVTPAIDPTANWKTYNNLGISFKYPANWISEKYEVSGRAEHHGLLRLKSENYQSEMPSVPLFIHYWDNPEDLTIEQYDKKINQGAAMLYPLYNSQAQTMTLGGLTARYEPRGDCSPFNCYKYVISVQNKIWEISSQYATDPIEFKSIVDQILSTFKFLEPTSEATGNLKEAKEALINYFSLLNEGKYAEAVKYHGSGYDYLINWNPSVKPSDYPKLLESGCTQNGLHCLRIKGFVSGKEISAEECLFVVQFANQDGSLFKRGPCCGATEAEMPTKTDFEFTVKKEGNNYLVVTQPVYTP